MYNINGSIGGGTMNKSFTQDNLNMMQPSSSSLSMAIASNLMGSANKYMMNNTDRFKPNSPNDHSNIDNSPNNNTNNNNNNFKVVIRIRPFLQKEIETGKLIPTLQVLKENKMIQAIEYYNHDFPENMTLQEILENTNKYILHQFTFDHIFSDHATQLEVYEYTAKPAVQSMLKGYNATILAYGQTGTGKTHTMEGFKYSNQDPHRGIIPRCMEEIFHYIDNISNSKTTFMVRASYLQIYNETISDLLKPDATNLIIREDKKKGLYVEGLSEWVVRGPSEIYSLMQKGAASRATASTKMNDVSSRSHAVFVIMVEQMVMMGNQEGYSGGGNGSSGSFEQLGEIRIGKLNLVDLAGSERIRSTGATGQRLEECKKINQSLSALGNVISALADQKQPKNHIPYRDSKITRLLEDSLGGNCITTMMVMVSPSIDAFSETLSSIKFANRAKNIRNAPVINEDMDQKALVRKYEAELKRLRSELDEKNKTLIDKRIIYELEEERKQAEMHKAAAFAALEARSREFMQEREEKKKLEEKIRSMNSQVLIGGRKIEDTPQFRNALEEQQKIIRQQYEKRLQDLEKDLTQFSEDKAQVYQYKQLLLKQRDIMIALTTKLNERDETILQLQEELNACIKIHEDELMRERYRIKRLEQVLNDHDIGLPLDLRRDNSVNIGVVGCEGICNEMTNKSLIGEEEEEENEEVELGKRKERNKLKNDVEMWKMKDCKKNEVSSLYEELQKAHETELSLLTIIQQKDDHIKSLQKGNNPNDSPYDYPHHHQDCLIHQFEIKNNIDHIIETLSCQNDPHQLQEIAKKLLNLQRFINSNMLAMPNGDLDKDKEKDFGLSMGLGLSLGYGLSSTSTSTSILNPILTSTSNPVLNNSNHGRFNGSSENIKGSLTSTPTLRQTQRLNSKVFEDDHQHQYPHQQQYLALKESGVMNMSNSLKNSSSMCQSSTISPQSNAGRKSSMAANYDHLNRHHPSSPDIFIKYMNSSTPNSLKSDMSKPSLLRSKSNMNYKDGSLTPPAMTTTTTTACQPGSLANPIKNQSLGLANNSISTGIGIGTGTGISTSTNNMQEKSRNLRMMV